MKLFAELAVGAARIATGRLGWSPEQFWGGTAMEFRTAIEGAFGLEPSSPALSSVDLARLKEMFPDG